MTGSNGIRLDRHRVHHCTISEAARYLGTNEQVILRRIESGSLTAEWNGSNWFVLLPVRHADRHNLSGTVARDLNIGERFPDEEIDARSENDRASSQAHGDVEPHSRASASQNSDARLAITTTGTLVPVNHVGARALSPFRTLEPDHSGASRGKTAFQVALVVVALIFALTTWLDYFLTRPNLPVFGASVEPAVAIHDQAADSAAVDQPGSEPPATEATAGDSADSNQVGAVTEDDEAESDENLAAANESDEAESDENSAAVGEEAESTDDSTVVEEEAESVETNATPAPIVMVESDRASIAQPFRGFWEQSGGLPIFGYPITQSFLDPETGAVVQYFERTRLELSMRDGSPVIRVGRLGESNADHRNLLETQPFQVTPAGRQLDPDCTFFPPTGHSLCGAFYDFWTGHGIDGNEIDDPFMASLELFGYPISEEFDDPVTGLRVQYFERARFELHPMLPEDEQVLLGRLAAELLSEREREEQE